MITWELDFYSRPILDEQNKKVWEVLVCESPLNSRSDPESLFRYAQYCPSTQVNSLWLKTTLEAAIAQAPKPPNKIRFFRQAMNNMITRACDEIGISAQLSRRTLTLHQWLQQRMQEVYPQHPGYQTSQSPGVVFPISQAAPLPDALIGQQWAFVNLEASAFEEMSEWEIDFGESFPLSLAGLSPDTPIPGLIIFSQRALALAGWMSGLELAFLKYEESGSPTRLLLETGISDRWILASLTTPQTKAEATQFEATKQAAKGVHFLAIQTNSQTEAFAGFWLLQEVNLT